MSEGKRYWRRPINRGEIYGLVEVTSEPFMRTGNRHVMGKCACGSPERAWRADRILSGYTRSCGCVRREIITKLGRASKTHGEKGTKLHNSWRGMHERCSNPNNIMYPRYGGRGIVICTEWAGYIPFREWAHSHGYVEGLTIERINRHGNYEPPNCEWITRREQVLRAWADGAYDERVAKQRNKTPKATESGLALAQ